MTINNLKRLKKKLPVRYGKAIAAKLNTPLIDAQKVTRVMNGEITDPSIVIPVLDAAAQLIQDQQIVKKRLAKALKAA